MQRKFNEVSKKRFWKSRSLRSKKFVTGVFWKFFKQIFLRKLPGGFFLILYLTLKVNSFKSLFARVFVKPFTGFLLLQLRNDRTQKDKKKDTLREEIWSISVYSPNAGKYRPEKTPYLDNFHTVTAFSKRTPLHIILWKLHRFFLVTVFSKHLHIMPFTRFCIYVLEYFLTLIQKDIWCNILRIL